MPTGTALRLTASVGGNRAAGPPGFMGMTDHSDLGTHLIGSRRHAREETSSGRSPANKARSAVRAARVPPSDRAQEPGLPAGRDGWPDCPLGVAGTRRPRHACIAFGAPPGPVHRGRRVTQTGEAPTSTVFGPSGCPLGHLVLPVTVYDDEIAALAADDADLPAGRLTVSAPRIQVFARWSARR